MLHLISSTTGAAAVTVIVYQGQVEVVGSGAITVVDPSALEFSSMDVAKVNDPVCMLGIKLHILIQGSRFNLHTREASPGTVGAAKG